MEEGDLDKYEIGGAAGTNICDTDCDEQSYNYKDDYLDMNYGSKHWLTTFWYLLYLGSRPQLSLNSQKGTTFLLLKSPPKKILCRIVVDDFSKGKYCMPLVFIHLL